MHVPPPTIRLCPVFIVMAFGCSMLFLLGPLATAVLVVIFAPVDVSTYLAPGMIGFVVIMARVMSSSVQWVELDDGVLRTRRLLTRKIVVHRVRDIVAVKPLNSNLMGPAENALADLMMGTSNRGYELRFRDGSKLGLVRGDMAGLDEFLKVLAVEIAGRCGPLSLPDVPTPCRPRRIAFASALSLPASVGSHLRQHEEPETDREQFIHDLDHAADIVALLRCRRSSVTRAMGDWPGPVP